MGHASSCIFLNLFLYAIFISGATNDTKATSENRNLGLELALPIALGLLFFFVIITMSVACYYRKKNEEHFLKKSVRNEVISNKHPKKIFPKVPPKPIDISKANCITAIPSSPKKTTINQVNIPKKPIRLPKPLVNQKSNFDLEKSNDIYYESETKWQAGKVARQAHECKAQFNGYEHGTNFNLSSKDTSRKQNNCNIAEDKHKIINFNELKDKFNKTLEEANLRGNGSGTDKADRQNLISNSENFQNSNFEIYGNFYEKNLYLEHGNPNMKTISTIHKNIVDQRDSGVDSAENDTFSSKNTKTTTNMQLEKINGDNWEFLEPSKENISEDESFSSLSGIVDYDDNLNLPKIFKLKNDNLKNDIETRLKLKQNIMNNTVLKGSSSGFNDDIDIANTSNNGGDASQTYTTEHNGFHSGYHEITNLGFDNNDYQQLDFDSMRDFNNSDYNLDDNDEQIEGFECIVKYPYKARYDDDISLCLGDVLFVNQVLKNGWWRGIKQNLEGFFPGSYVEKKAYNDDLTERTKSSLIELSEALKVEGLVKGGVDEEIIYKKKNAKAERFSNSTISKFFSKKFSVLTEAVRNGVITEKLARISMNEEKDKNYKIKRVKSSLKAKKRKDAPEPPSNFDNLSNLKKIDHRNDSVNYNLFPIYNDVPLRVKSNNKYTSKTSLFCGSNDDIYANSSQVTNTASSNVSESNNPKPSFTDIFSKPKVFPKNFKMTSSLMNLHNQGLTTASKHKRMSESGFNESYYVPQNTLEAESNWKKNNQMRSIRDPEKPIRTKKLKSTNDSPELKTWSPNVARITMNFEDELKMRLDRKILNG